MDQDKKNKEAHSSTYYDSLKKAFAENLRKYMELKGETRRSIEAKTGIPYSTFTEWLSGNRYPSPARLKILADFFEIPIYKLNEGAEPIIPERFRLSPEENKLMRKRNALRETMKELSEESLDILAKLIPLLPKKDK